MVLKNDYIELNSPKDVEDNNVACIIRWIFHLIPNDIYTEEEYLKFIIFTQNKRDSNK